MPDSNHIIMPLYSAQQTRTLDRLAIEQGAIPGFELMKRAGRAAFRALRRRWPDAGRIVLVCGSGNNGGDGLVIAGLAQEQGWAVTLMLLNAESARARLQGEAKQALAWAEARGVVIKDFDPQRQASEFDLVVDALLGTGITGPVRDEHAAAIEWINQSGLPVIALDIPSGLCSDTGRILGHAVSADMTVTFIGTKQGLLTHQGVEQCGELLFDDLQIAPDIRARVPSAVASLGEGYLAANLPRRARNSHKGCFGHVLVVGGDQGMGGAVAMAARSAARSGAGLVTVATRAEHVGQCHTLCPEAMVYGVRSGQELAPLLERATVVLIGPGLGKDAWSGQLLHAVQGSGLPMVVDADALNLLLQGQLVEQRYRKNWILTPHPGEAARLLDCDSARIQADRFAAAEQIQQLFGGICVLKGAGTLIRSADQTLLCRQGNPGMASGGMGDVLGGVIAALVAQQFPLQVAAAAAVQAHASAADACANLYGERGLLAMDLIDPIRKLLNGVAANPAEICHE